MATATRTATVNDPVGIHARPAAEFAQAATASGCTVTIAKQGDTIEITVDGDNAEAVADNLVATLIKD